MPQGVGIQDLDHEEIRRELNATVQRGRMHHKDLDKQDGLAFLIVKSMLLTGFDAPVKQGLYLDRIIAQLHEIFQAIARVNRTCKNKKAGRVIDYIGRGGRVIQEALKLYDAADVEGALEGVEDQIPLLRDRHQRVKDVLKHQGVEDITQLEGVVLVLRDERVRADFVVKLKAFLETLDTVMPDPAGLPFVWDAKILGFITRSAAAHYRDGQVDLRGVGEKVRKLIDDHITSLGVTVQVEPVSILDVNFDSAVNRHVSDRAKASEMEHALRAHIRQHFEEDPVRCQRLSERLEQVLTAMKDNWVEIIKAWRAMMEEVRNEGQEDAFGLDPRIQAPFDYRLLLVNPDDGEPLRLRKGRLQLYWDRVQDGPVLLRQWYVRLGREWLPCWVRHLAAHVGVEVPSSCSGRGSRIQMRICLYNRRIYFSWSGDDRTQYMVEDALGRVGRVVRFYREMQIALVRVPRRKFSGNRSTLPTLPTPSAFEVIHGGTIVRFDGQH